MPGDLPNTQAQLVRSGTAAISAAAGTSAVSGPCLASPCHFFVSQKKYEEETL